MLNALKKRNFVIIIVMLIISCFFFWLGSNKIIWFCDEVSTYMSANSCSKEYPLSTSKWITGDDFSAYLAATPGESYNFKLIANQLYADHVPLYFWLFRIFSMLATDSSSKWIGLSLNFFFYIILCYILKKFFERNGAGTDRQIVIGLMILIVMLHPVVLSEATTIRMYLMFSSFQMGFLYILNHKRNDIKYGIGLWLITTMGLLTHFYLWIWLSIFSIFYIIYLYYLIYRKQAFFKNIIYYVAIIFLSIVTSTLIFPQWIWNLFFADSKGKIAFANIFHLNGLLAELQSALTTLTRLLSVKKFTLLPGGVLLFIMLMFVYFLSRKSAYKIWLIIISGIIYSFLVVHTQPTAEERYLWPVCVLILVALLEVLVTDTEFLCGKIAAKLKHPVKIIVPICILVILLIMVTKASFKFGNIAYLRARTDADYQLLLESTDSPWLVFYNDIDWQFKCSMYDFRLPNQIKRVAIGAAGSYDAVIEDTSELIIYTIDSIQSIDKCIEYINESCSKSNCQYEKIGNSFYMSIYRITWN